MPVALRASQDGTSGAIQLNGADVVQFDHTGLVGLQIGADTPLVSPIVTNYTETVNVVSGTSLPINLDTGTIQRLATTGNASITLPGSEAGKSFVVIVSYGGAHTITWAGGSTIKWNGGIAPTPTSTSGKFDIFTFFQDGTNTYGSVFGQGF